MLWCIEKKDYNTTDLNLLEKITNFVL